MGSKQRKKQQEKNLNRGIWAMTKVSNRLLNRFNGIADVNVRDLIACAVTAGWLSNHKGSEQFYNGKPMTRSRVYTVADDILAGRGAGLFPGPYVCFCGQPKGRSKQLCKACEKKARDTARAVKLSALAQQRKGMPNNNEGGEQCH